MKASARIVLAVFALALVGGLALPEGAAACGMKCANVAPAGQPRCFRCVEDPDSPAACANQGACSCVFVQCLQASAAPSEEPEAVLASIFSEQADPADCTGLPPEITAP